MKELLFTNYILLLLSITFSGIKTNVSAAETIQLNWVDAGTPYKDKKAKEGDTVQFNWAGMHNVYIHPTGDCDKTGAILVGETTGATYTFTSLLDKVTFVCDVGSHCDYGQIITFNVGEESDGEESSGFSMSIGVGLTIGLISAMLMLS